jgi:hypothetical protein
MTINLDRSIFNVFCQYTSGVEAVTDPSLTRDEMISDILHGQSGFTDVVAVIEFNAVEGWSRNITADVMAEVEALREPSGEYSFLTGQNAIEARWDHERELRAEEM